MYNWLSDALRDSSQVVTASRRLARVLIDDYGRQQAQMGRMAWLSPSILSWRDWLDEQLHTAQSPQLLPTRINAHQSRVLWERCLSREINDHLLNLRSLVRQTQDTWLRLHEWNVSIETVEQSAQGQDQRIFARAARNYRSILDRERWVDDAGLAGLVVELIGAGKLAVPPRIVMAGFDRIVPQVHSVSVALGESGCKVNLAAVPPKTGRTVLYSYENSDAEMRAAGAWARRELETLPTQRIAIVASNLEHDSVRRGRLLREGFVPGWQYSKSAYGAAVNVSYGRRLADYPAIAIAMLALRWLQSDLSTREISLLLLTPMIGRGDSAGRARLELNLRQLPERNWSPEMLLGALQGRDETADAVDWLRRVATLGEQELPQRTSPSSWAKFIDELLRKLNWPGDDSLGSVEFQVLNRWRELLNDLARLELVIPTMTFAEAFSRLSSIASETVFQAETEAAVVHLLGPLEAAGMQFDKLWVSGLSVASWPPVGKPLALVSRQLQRRLGMPDADAKDTMEYAQRVLQRLTHSAPSIVCSYPQTDADADQVVTALLERFSDEREDGPSDPGWHASQLRDSANLVQISEDPVPAVTADESVSGGAATVQRQFGDPFAAFVVGRLGVKALQAITSGLSASLRGSLIHAALYQLYADLPSQAAIRDWSNDELQARINGAMQSAFSRHERYADPVLKQLLLLERQRVAVLLQKLVAVDVGREPFTIANVEGKLNITISGVQLSLRVDRIDRLDDGSLIILDYKTGIRKTFLDRNHEPKDMQLVVYACAVGDPVAGLGLVNIDSRSISIDGAGRAFREDDDWESTLTKWISQVEMAAADMQRGDVRINGLQSANVARPLSLLSRIGELLREG